MASNYTTNYNLCQWEPTDQVQRTDFNADNAKLDAALADLAEDVAGKAEQTDLSALQAVVSGKADQSTVSDLTSTRNCRVYYKTYTGSGSGNCSFTFPAKPMIVMVMGGGYWLCLLQGQSEGQSRNAVTRSTYIDTVWSGNSVTWSINDVDLQCNRKDTTYSLVAVLQV